MKSKPTQIIVHRIEFQQKEREMLSSLNAALITNRLATPIVEILKDVSAMTTLVTAYLVWRYGEQVIDSLGDTYQTTQELVTDALRIAKNNKDIARAAGRGVPIPFVGTSGTIFDAFDVIFG